MSKTDGTLSIENKNVFNILKKWLYTEDNVVFRELISNAIDAIEKRKNIDLEKLSYNGCIKIILNEENNTIIIRDNGIGMTYEEVNKYINQIAFSGATEFISMSENSQNTIIGHFGVGFYSSFMLCSNVAIETKSYKDEKAVRWDCNDDMNFKMKYCDKNDIGTDVILYLKDNKYTKNPSMTREIIKSYFEFSPVQIIFYANSFDTVQINNSFPVWKKFGDNSIEHKKELNAFYKEFFNDVSDPIFTVNIMSPDIGVNGILFFRETNDDTKELDGVIKVYCKGVYVGENIKELIPSFVNLQNGIIECNNLPLVVSRSTIMGDDNSNNAMAVISECLSQEVTIALNDMFTKNRDLYEKHWENINAFVKYSILKDKTFGSVMTRKAIFKDLYGNFKTVDEYLSTSSSPETIYYTSDSVEQAHYVEIFKKCNMNALNFDHVIDNPYMRRYEVLKPNLKFIRIDSNISSLYEGIIFDSDKEKIEKLTEFFNASVGERLKKFSLRITNLDQSSISTVIINDEKSRRMSDMLEIYGYINRQDFSAKTIQSNSTFLINLKNEVVQKILYCNDEQLINDICNQLFDLSLVSQQMLTPEDTLSFINRSERLLHIL